MKYMVVSGGEYDGPHSEGFDSAVQRAIRDGWKPRGGVTVIMERGQLRFFHAMTLWEPDDGE